MKKKIIIFFSLITFLISCISTGSIIEASETTDKAEVSIIAPTKKATYTYVKTSDKNKVFTLKYKLTGGVKETVSFKSSNKSVAVVNNKGIVTLKNTGTSKVTVIVTLDDGKKVKDSVTIKVVKPKVTITAPTKKSTYTLKKKKDVNKSFYLKYSANFSTKYVKLVNYKSSNKAVATVNSKGKIVAKTTGKTNITVYVKLKSGKIIKDNLKITVKNSTTEATTEKEKEEVVVEKKHECDYEKLNLTSLPKKIVVPVRTWDKWNYIEYTKLVEQYGSDWYCFVDGSEICVNEKHYLVHVSPEKVVPGKYTCCCGRVFTGSEEDHIKEYHIEYYNAHYPDLSGEEYKNLLDRSDWACRGCKSGDCQDPHFSGYSEYEITFEKIK